MAKSRLTQEYQVLVELLRARRLAAKVTQIELAVRMGQTQSYISKVERGELRLDALQLRQFCQAIGCSFVGLVREFDATLNRHS